MNKKMHFLTGDYECAVASVSGVHVEKVGVRFTGV